MISGITAYIKTIAIFLVFSAFVEIILPDTRFKKYISIVMGLLMIGVVISPILHIDFPEELGISQSFDIPDYSARLDRYDEEHKALVEEIYSKLSEEALKATEAADGQGEENDG